MIYPKLPIFIFIFCLSISLKGQSLDKANSLYKDGAYAKAIPIYEALLKKKPSVAIKSKLANSYRILNLPQKAASFYSDLIKETRVDPTDYFRYGEVMMMLSQYDSAKVYFTLFNEIKPENEQGIMMLKSLLRIADIQPILKNIIIQPFKHNSESDENVPVFTPKGLVFASDRHTGFNLLKQKNETTGREYIKLYISEKLGDTAFAVPKELSSKFSELNKNTGNISFTTNGKYAFFCRNSNKESKSGAYNMQLFSAESNGKNGWKKIKTLPFCSVDNNYMYPSVSPDGNRLFFVMERADGYGGLDMYVSKKTKKGWSKPDNLGEKVNTSAHEGFPYVAQDGKLYFCSKGHAGYGGYDIFVTTQDSTSGEWLAPQNVGMPINSAYDDISLSFADSAWGAFTSARSGRGDDVFFFKIVPSQPTLDALQSSHQKDVNTGFIFDTVSNEPIEDVELSDLTDLETAPVNHYVDVLSAKIHKRELSDNEVFIMDNIDFISADSITLTDAMKTDLDKVVLLLLQHKKINVEIGAHACKNRVYTEGGATTDNEHALTQKQSDAVVQYMISKGVKSKRLVSKGYGHKRPIKDCSEGGCPPEEELENCRVELKILKQ